MSDIAIAVDPGEIRIASIWLMRATKDVIWIMLDLASKYAEFGCYGSNSENGEQLFCLCAADDTLHLDKTRRGTDTMIRIRGIPAGWETVTSMGGGYTGHIVALRQDSATGDDGMMWEASK